MRVWFPFIIRLSSLYFAFSEQGVLWICSLIYAELIEINNNTERKPQ